MSRTRRTTKGSSTSGGVPQSPETSMKPFEVSHSKAKLARRCLKAYDYKYIQKLARRVKSRPLLVGSLVHSCIEMYFKEGHYLPAITEWKKKEFSKMFVEERALHADVVPLVKSLVRGYISNWNSSGYEMIWVEKDFRLDITPEGDDVGIILVGKIDGKCRENRFTWLVEHKTAKRMPGEEMRIFDTQVVLYNAALELMGEEPTTGVMWDYLRTELPVKPEVLARGGGLSQSMKIDTTKEVYLREIKRHGFDPRGYQPILEHLESKRDQFYRQVKLPTSSEMGQSVLNDIIATSRLVMTLTEAQAMNPEGVNPFTRNLTRDCSWCDFAPLCHAELRGEDTSYMRKHDYIVRTKNASQEIEIDTTE